MSKSEANKKLIKDTYDKVSASSELMERLMEMEQREQISKKRRNRWGMKVAAAVLAVSLTGGISAYAAGLLKPVADVFGNVFHLSEEDKKTAEEMGQSVGISDEDAGVEVTVDGVMADGYHYAMVLSVARTDGKSLAKEPKTKIDEWNFEEVDLTVDGKEFAWGGSVDSFDKNPDDNTIQCVMLYSGDDLMEDIDSMELHLSNLRNFSAEDISNRLIVEGEWKMKFPSKIKNVAKDIVKDQTIQIKGKKYNISKIAISPIGYYMEYTIPRSMSEHMQDYMRNLENSNTKLELVFKDGTSINLQECGSGVKVDRDLVKFEFSDTFDKLIQMDEIQCVRIDGKEFR